MRWKGSLLFALLLLGGCANVPREAGFADVEKLVAERGVARVHWNRGTASDEAVALAVKGMVSNDLTVEEAVQIALLNNRGLQAVYEDLMLAQADLVAAGLLRNPIFDAEIRFHEGVKEVGGEYAIVQDFLDVFQIPLRKRIAAARFEAVKARVAEAVMDLVADTRAQFFALESAHQLVEMRETVVKATGASLALARRLREAGNNTELDLILERTQAEQAKLDLAAAEEQVLFAREQLNGLMGLWGQAAAAWKAPGRVPDLPPVEQPLESLERRAVERNLQLAAFRNEIEAAGRALGLSRTFGLIPELEAGASAEHEPDGAWAVGPSLSLPIPLFNQGQPAIAAAQAELRRSRAAYYAAAVEVRTVVRAARARLQSARDRADYQRRVVLPLRAQAVEQAQLQYNAMQIGAFQLLQVKQQQIEAGAQHIQTLRDYWIARVDLDALLNGALRRGGSDVAGTSLTASGSSGSDGNSGGH